MVEWRVFFSSIFKLAVAGLLAVALTACSSARFEDINGPLYSGGPGAAPVAAAAPVSRRAPVERVERGGSDPIRYYPSPSEGPLADRRVASASPSYPNDANPAARYPSGPAGAHAYGGTSAESNAAQGRQGAHGPYGSDAGASGAGGGENARAQPVYRHAGTARWMGASWVGHTTTTQEPFEPERLTGAHATLPLPSYVYVTNRANRRTVLIRVNDRPPATTQDPNVVVVVSRRVADLLGFSRAGTAEVDLQYAGAAGLVSSGRHEEAFLRRQPWLADALGIGRQAQAQRQPQPQVQWSAGRSP